MCIRDRCHARGIAYRGRQTGRRVKPSFRRASWWLAIIIIIIIIIMSDGFGTKNKKWNLVGLWCWWWLWWWWDICSFVCDFCAVIRVPTLRNSGCVAFRTSAIKLRSVRVNQIVWKFIYVLLLEWISQRYLLPVRMPVWLLRNSCLKGHCRTAHYYWPAYTYCRGGAD